MRKLGLALAGVALAAAAVTVSARGGADIVAGPGPFQFAQSYTTEQVVASWTPRNGGKADGGYWVRIDCYANATTTVGDPPATPEAGSVVYAQYADLTPPIVQSGFTFGPTPSWSGGGADCSLRLYALNNGAFGNPVATSGTFGAQP